MPFIYTVDTCWVLTRKSRKTLFLGITDYCLNRLSIKQVKNREKSINMANKSIQIMQLADVHIEDVEYTKMNEEFFPECWANDERMDVLFAPFRVKSVNPQNYESKLKFWKNLIIKYCDAKGSSKVTASELCCAFMRSNKKPYGLQTVLNEMETAGDLKAKTLFMEQAPKSWSGWTVGLVVKTIQWGYGKVKDRVVQPTNTETEYVVLEVVKKQSQIIQQKCASQEIISIENMLSSLTDTCITTEGAHLALHFLITQQRAIVEALNFHQENKTIVKIGNTKVEPITETEKSIYNLKETEKFLTKIVSELESNMNDMDIELKTLVREQKMQSAKNMLRKKRVLSRNLEKKASSLENIQTLLTNIYDTKYNANIIEAYKIGSNTLKQTLSDSGVTLEAIDDAMDDIKEVFDVNNEIQATMGSIQVIENAADESALEKELAELLEIDQTVQNTTTEQLFLDDSIERRLRQLNVNELADLPLNVAYQIYSRDQERAAAPQ